MKTTKDTEIKVKIDISPGKVTEHQKHLWKSWWKLRIISARKELDNREEINNG